MKKPGLDAAAFVCRLQDFLLVQNRLCKRVSFISELQGEKRDILIQQPQKDFVAFPDGEGEKRFLFDLVKLALVAVLDPA